MRVRATPLNVPVRLDAAGIVKETSLSVCLVEVETKDGKTGHGLTAITEEEVGGGPPAQESPVTACPHRRQVTRLEAGRAVAHAVDTAMLGNQGAGAQALPDLLDRYARPQQLRTRDHPLRSTPVRATRYSTVLSCCPMGALRQDGGELRPRKRQGRVGFRPP
jgi:hypothetical protein